MTKHQEYLIYLEDVFQKYPDESGQLHTILNDIDFQVHAGEFITVVGPTGCGKSTLLRLILGSEKPYSGTVLIDGKSVDDPNSCCGIVYQKYSLFPHLTVLENIMFGPELKRFNLFEKYYRPFYYKQKKKEFKEEAIEYLNRVGLTADAGKYPHQLSGGMRQRVAIAQALIMKPKILLMDEPFGALDDSTRQIMQLFILEQWEKLKMTIFFVTHDLEEAIFLGTRIVVLSQYYKTDCPDCEGSKIVTDKSIPGDHPKATKVKYIQEFSQLLDQIRKVGLDPKYKQHISKFDLSHKDSFRTVSKEEWKK